MTHSPTINTCDNPLEQCLNNFELKNPKQNMNNILSSFNKLQIVETVEDLLTDDEDDVNCNITDDEEYFSACEDSFQAERSPCLNYTLLYNSTHERLSLATLKEKCDQLELSIKDTEAKKIERLTRDQANSSEWHEFRKGRITASVFKSVCSTKIEKPSISLLTKICYPEKAVFTSKYTEWGRRHEKKALKEFIITMMATHTKFTESDSGLVVIPRYPYFGASPDGLCCCDCCGKGCIEIKCPYTLKNGESFDVLTTKTNPFLIKNNEQYDLNKNHAYYFQMQMQIFLTNSSYCYFIVWSPKSLLQIKVLPDEKFWLKHSSKAESFFKCVVLPELLGKYFTRQNAELTGK